MQAELDARHIVHAAGRSKLVGDIVAIAREWVAEVAPQVPEFAGAYLYGGITAVPADALFSLYRDVDMIIVAPPGEYAATGNLEVLYRGVLLEVGFMDLDAHRDPDAVLAHPDLAPNIAATTILADPTGLLGPLQRVVAAEYAQRRWVQARCEAERATAREQLAALREVATPTDGYEPLWWLLSALSNGLALARLRRPTHRRSLTLLRELLEEQGRPDLHERALALWGCEWLSRGAVQALLGQTATAWDRAVAVYHTPTPFGFKLQPHVRPYIVEASQELIDEGHHREAVFWFAMGTWAAYLALRNDAPADEQPQVEADLQALYATLGYTTPDAWQRRVDEAEQLTDEIFRIADELVAMLPA